MTLPAELSTLLFPFLDQLRASESKLEPSIGTHRHQKSLRLQRSIKCKLGCGPCAPVLMWWHSRARSIQGHFPSPSEVSGINLENPFQYNRACIASSNRHPSRHFISCTLRVALYSKKSYFEILKSFPPSF